MLTFFYFFCQLPPGNKRTSSGAGVPLQTNFVIPDGSQTKHQRNQSKATIETKGRSRASSWAPVTDIPENDLTDIVQGPAELAEPIVLAAPETNVDVRLRSIQCVDGIIFNLTRHFFCAGKTEKSQKEKT